MFRECGPHAVKFIEKYFYDCVYTKQDLIGFCFGMTSIVIWLFAQVPQFVSNIRNQSAEALSPWFLANWLMGDTCNLLGCLIQGQQLPTTTYTAMYFVVADAIMMIQYIYYNALQKRMQRLRHRRSRHRHSKRHHRHHEDPSSSHTTLTVEPTPTSTPRSPTLSPTHSVPPTLLPRGTAIVASTTALLVVVLYVHQASLFNLIPTSSSSPPSSRTLSYQPLSLPTTHPHHPHLSSPSSSQASPFRTSDWNILVGTGLGWASSVLYLMSRISQITKNHQRQTAEGLSLAMFACAVTANLLTGTSIILRAASMSDLWGTQGPWIVGSLGTISLDVIIFSQAIHFGALWKQGPGEVGESGSSQQQRDRQGVEAPLLQQSDPN